MKYKGLCTRLANSIEQIDGYCEGKRSFKNNNPGNLWDGNNKRVYKKIPVDSDGYLIFPSYEAGRKALEKDILLKTLSGHTLETYVKTFTSDEKYLKVIAEVSGIAKDKKLKEMIDTCL